MIKQFAREPGLAAGISSDKPTYVPDMQQLTQALNNFQSILREKNRATTPDITLIELGSAGVTEQNLLGDEGPVVPIPDRGLATSTITPINMDINVTLEPTLGLLVLSKDGYSETFKVNCQFINWPIDNSTFESLVEAPIESLTPIAPLPTPLPKVQNPKLDGPQYIALTSVLDRSTVAWLPEVIVVDAFHSQGNNKIELYINGNFVASQPGVSTGGSYSFHTDPNIDYEYYLNNLDSLTKGIFIYYAVLIGDNGTISSTTSTVRLSSRFLSPDSGISGGQSIENTITVSSAASGLHGISGSLGIEIPVTASGTDANFFGSAANVIDLITVFTGTASTGYPESSHPLTTPLDINWTWSFPNQNYPALHLDFNSNTNLGSNTYLQITDEFYTPVYGSPFYGTQLANQSVHVNGNTFKMRLFTSDSSNIIDFGGGTVGWGFALTSIHSGDNPSSMAYGGWGIM